MQVGGIQVWIRHCSCLQAEKYFSYRSIGAGRARMTNMKVDSIAIVSAERSREYETETKTEVGQPGRA